MNVKTMEGLAGAGVNLKNSGTSYRVYHAAKIEADLAEIKGEAANTDVMERALGYTNGFLEDASEYTDRAAEGTREEAEKLREERLEDAREKARERAENRKEEEAARAEKAKAEKAVAEEQAKRAKAEKAGTDKAAGTGTDGLAENSESILKNQSIATGATVELSAEGQKLSDAMKGISRQTE